MAFLFYIVSIFGIFNVGYDRKCVSINCKFNVKLNDVNNIIIKFNNSTTEQKAVEMQSDCEVVEINNSFVIDKKVKKRLKFLRIMKILSYIAILAFVIYGFVSGLFAKLF